MIGQRDIRTNHRRNKSIQQIAFSAFVLGLIGVATLTGCLVSPESLVASGKSNASPNSSQNAEGGPTVALASIQAIMQNNCVSCHSSFPAYTDQQWIEEGYVVAGNPDDSLLFQNLTNAISGGNGTMPPGGPLPANEISLIQSWIIQLATPAPAPTTGSGPGPAPSPSPTPSPGSLNATQRTAAAVAVIQRDCASCHTSASPTATMTGYFPGSAVPEFGAFTTDNQFVQAGLVTEGVLSESWLYQALSSYGSGTGGNAGLMPNGEPAISASDAAALNAWITGIGSP